MGCDVIVQRSGVDSSHGDSSKVALWRVPRAVEWSKPLSRRIENPRARVPSFLTLGEFDIALLFRQSVEFSEGRAYQTRTKKDNKDGTVLGL